MKSFHFAPVQGHTDTAYRHFHTKEYGGDIVYYTPFIRLEKNSLRPKDLKDLTSDLNQNIHLIPQIIFKDAYELNSLVEIIKNIGFKEINLNMGCPFPLQTGHGRGAATIKNKELAEEVVKCIKNNPEITFSVKMRLGLNDPEEWRILLSHLNKVKLSYVIIHPRIAKQQYKGDIDYAQFDSFVKESINPVIYNGDIKTPDDIANIISKYPEIDGIMIGRGLLCRPSLVNEYTEGKIMEKELRIKKLMDFHRVLLSHYESILCGDDQLISKIQPFWEYSEEEIGRKAWKSIKKAVNISKYQTAVASIKIN